MTFEGLMALVEASEARRVEAGEDPADARLILSVPLRREPKNWDRAQVVPGLFGRCCGWTGEGSIYVMDVKAKDIRAYLKRRGFTATEAGPAAGVKP